MDIEKELFKRTSVDIDKLINYGFVKEKEIYKYSKNFMDDNFKAIITINNKGIVSGNVYDLQIDEEYTNIRIKNNTGQFVNKVREEYIEILTNIKDNCFIKTYFIYDQANRITKYIINKYQDEPQFVWDKFPGYGVFRNQNNKWYGIIMNIDKSKIDNDTGKIEILNVKASENVIKSFINKKGFYEGYHMNKKNWITIILNDTISDEIIFDFINNSYNLVK